MNTETKTCQNCKNQFVIEPEDFQFYEKIKVPPPTWCPECRLQRRMVFENERTIYKRNCDLCKRESVFLFPKESPYTVYCRDCWWSDKWDPLSYGRDYDFSRPFFEQLAELFRRVPQLGRSVMTTVVNSEYCNAASYLKNCYLVFNSDYDEDCLFSTYLERSKSSLDLWMADLCERCYEGRNLFKDFDVRWSDNCNECLDVSFSKNCIGCSHCFGCVNLRHKQYHIFNKPYSKDDYFKELKKYDTGSFKAVEDIKKRAREFSLRYPRKFAEGLQRENFSGDYVFNSKNTFYSDEVGDCRDCKYCQFLFLPSTADAYDYTMWGGGAERIYECMGVGGGAEIVRFSSIGWAEHTNVEYSRDILVATSDLFGCIASKSNKHCILNKQYSAKEYQELREKIIAHMNEMPYVDKRGRVYKYGEFLPPELSPFAYNETIAQAHRPLTKAGAEKAGFSWRDVEPSPHKPTVKAADLPDNIKDVPDSILNEIIECAHRGGCIDQCPGAFRIVPQELAFYRQMSIPLPRLCHNCRHYARLFAHNPIMKLYARTCQCSGEKSANGIYKNSTAHFHGDKPCPNQFQTSYAPDRPEIVYCEQCYNAEVA